MIILLFKRGEGGGLAAQLRKMLLPPFTRSSSLHTTPHNMSSIYKYFFGGHGHDHYNHRHDPKKTCIELYTARTPNGQKASITLEALGVNYKAIKIDLAGDQQKKDWFLKINPNCRIPVIVDKSHMHTKHDMNVSESGSIQMYLVEHFDPDHYISFDHGCRQHWEMLEWLFFVSSGIEPMQGQVNHFKNKAPENLPYAIRWFEEETKRLYSVLDCRLKHMKVTMPKDIKEEDEEEEEEEEEDGKHGHKHHHRGMFLVGYKFSIADIATFAWVNQAEESGIDMTGMVHLMEWRECIRKMDCVKRGLNVPQILRVPTSSWIPTLPPIAEGRTRRLPAAANQKNNTKASKAALWGSVLDIRVV